MKLICKICKKEFAARGKNAYKRKCCSRKCSAIDRKTWIPWNLGIPHSAETRKKISDKAKIHTKGKRNSMYGKRGAETGNWKGGISPLNFHIRQLFEYKEWRDNVYKRDGYMCQSCGKTSDSDLQAHHIKSFSKILMEMLQEFNQFSPIEDKDTLVRIAINYKPFWDVNNGVTVCKNCHSLKENHYGIYKICGVKYKHKEKK